MRVHSRADLARPVPPEVCCGFGTGRTEDILVGLKHLRLGKRRDLDFDTGLAVVAPLQRQQNRLLLFANEISLPVEFDVRPLRRGFRGERHPAGGAKLFFIKFARGLDRPGGDAIQVRPEIKSNTISAASSGNGRSAITHWAL